MSKVINSKDFNIVHLKNIVKDKAMLEVKFSDVDYTRTKEELDQEASEFGGNFKGHIVDMQTANMLVTVYDVLVKHDPKNKSKFERMMKTFTNFEKLVNFGWKQVK